MTEANHTYTHDMSSLKPSIQIAYHILNILHLINLKYIDSDVRMHRDSNCKNSGLQCDMNSH